MAKFDKLNEVFNIDKGEDQQVSSPSVVISHNVIKLPSEEFQKLPESDKVVLENKEYVRSELKNLVDICCNVIKETKDNMKEDSKPSELMAFSDLIRTTRDLLTELNTMDATENNLNIKRQSIKGFGNVPVNTNGEGITFTNSVTLTGSEVHAYMQKFKANSELNNIDTKFNTGNYIDND